MTKEDEPSIVVVGKPERGSEALAVGNRKSDKGSASVSGMTTVELRQNYRIPSLIYGTWHLHTHARTIDWATELGNLLRVFELGFVAIEASDTYQSVEELVARFRVEVLKKLGAEGAARLLVHHRISQSGQMPLTPADVRASVHRSLRRLNKERLDLVQLQWWNLESPGWLDAVAELGRLQDEGAVSAVGVTNFPTTAVKMLLSSGVPIVSNQVQMSLIDPRAQGKIREVCEDGNIHMLGYGALAGGFLSDRWLGQPDPGMIPTIEQSFEPMYRMIIDRFGGWSWLQKLLQVLSARAVHHHTDISTIALAWTLRRSGASALLVGISNPRRAEAYLRSLAIVLTEDDDSAIRSVLRRRAIINGEIADVERDYASRSENSVAAAAP
jgi:aryl-alcohol dehydrogenase-like predicted oxidoreductase